MERALKLIATRTLTIEVLRTNAHKGKGVTLPTHFNPYTGTTESKLKTGFNDSTWGGTTRLYVDSAKKLSENKFNTIIEEAKQYASIRSHARKPKTEVIEIIDKDERACLVVSEDEDNSKQCKFVLPFHDPTNIIIRIWSVNEESNAVGMKAFKEWVCRVRASLVILLLYHFHTRTVGLQNIVVLCMLLSLIDKLGLVCLFHLGTLLEN